MGIKKRCEARWAMRVPTKKRARGPDRPDGADWTGGLRGDRRRISL